ncbi:MAG: alkaline phosphatase D family protein [Hyphomicrobiaceae bacterium]
MPFSSLSSKTALTIGAAALATLVAVAVFSRSSGPAGDPGLAAALAPIRIARELAPNTALQRVAIGSCLRQTRPIPIFKDVMAAKPDVLLMIGDNVYGDFNDAEAGPLRTAYTALAGQPDYQRIRSAVPILPIWDDHDFGRNDGGADFAFRAVSGRLFHQFWGLQPQRPIDEGIHYSRLYGNAGRRLQIIMLDTRSFRSPIKRKTAAFEHWGNFEPDPDPAKTMLGDKQWAWLADELKKPADVRLIVSSIQVLAEGHGWERWGNLPYERQRFVELLGTVQGGALVLFSGDRHSGAFYSTSVKGREILELTTSSLNAPPPGPNRDARIPPLASDIFSKENFGLAEIDWDKRIVLLTLRGLNGEIFAERPVKF